MPRDPKNIAHEAIVTIFHGPMENLIITKLQEYYHESWWKEGVLRVLTSDLIKKLPENQKPKGRDLSEDPNSLKGKLDIVHIKWVVKENWDSVFKSFFGDDTIKEYLEGIHRVRNDFSHISPLSKEEAKETLEACVTILNFFDPVAANRIRPLIGELEEAVELPPFEHENFIGRAQELAHLQDLLLGEDAVPTIAIVGEPGVGKSTLVKAFAHQAAVQFQDGVLYCDAENLDIQGVVHSLVERVEPLAGRGVLSQPWQAWDRYLSKKAALIIIDNADNLSDLSFRPLGRSCKTILTLRNRVYPELLRLSSRAIFELCELDADQTLEMLRQRLQRSLAPGEVLAAYDLIKITGGLPLAIEMAAYYLNRNQALKIEDYVRDLSLSSLSPSPGMGVRRVFQVSLQSFPSDLQNYFASLGACAPGSFSVEVAKATGGNLFRDARAGLSQLADAYLLKRVAEGRFAFQPLLREFAREEALKRNLLAAAEERYYRWHAALAEQYSVYDDRVPKDIVAQNLPVLAREIEGILSTAEAKLASPEVDLGGWREFWRNIRKVFETRGHFERVVDLLETALEISQTQKEQSDNQDKRAYEAFEAYFQAQLGKFYSLAGRSGEAIKALEDALKLAKDDKERTEHINNSLGKERRRKKEFTKAIEVLQQNLDATGEMSAQNLAYTLNALGRVELAAGNPEKALEHLERALQIEKTDILIDRSCSITLSEAGRALRKLERHPEALAYFEEALALILDSNDPRGISILHNEIGETLGYLGRFPEAIEHHIQSMQQTSLVADPRSQIIVRKRMLKSLLPMNKKWKALKEQKQWDEALPLVIAWEQGERALGEMSYVFWAMINRGDVLARLKRLEEALKVYEEAKAIAWQHNDAHGIAVASRGMAWVFEDMHGKQNLQAALAELEVAESALLEYSSTGNDLQNIQYHKAYIIRKLEHDKPTDAKGDFWEKINQGNESARLEPSPQALEQFDQALVIAEEIGDPKLRSIAHQSRAKLLGRMLDEKHQQEALREWMKAELLEYERDPQDTEEVSKVLVSKGRLLKKMGKNQMAARLAEAALVYNPSSSEAQDLLERAATKGISSKSVKVGCKGMVKRMISRESEAKYFGFIRLEKPFDAKEVYFNPSSLECGWEDVQEGDHVIADWYEKPDGNWAANRVIKIE